MNEKILLDSSIMETEKRWKTVNDGVMGGLSSSEAFVNENEKIVFEGEISLKNNGGFASLRSPINNFNFEKFSGIEIRINGNGKQYNISMKETVNFTGYFYRIQFATEIKKYTTLTLPFNQFKLFYFGKEIISNKSIPLDKIKQISLLVSDKQEGNFIAEIDYIKLY